MPPKRKRVQNVEEDSQVEPKRKSAKSKHESKEEVPQEWMTETLSKRERRDYGPNQLKICFWNINGIRAVLRNGNVLKKLIDNETPDIVCFNETRIDVDQCGDYFDCLPGYRGTFCCSERKGYAGVGTFIRQGIEARVTFSGLDDEELDREGRVQTLEVSAPGIPTFYLVNTYVMNAGQKLVRLDFKVDRFNPTLYRYLNSLQQKHPVVWCGDLNVAHQEIDIWNSKNNQKSAGHTPKERASFGDFLSSEWVDVFRYRYPDTVQYTYWSARFPANYTTNKGWRLDYFVSSNDFLPYCKDVITLPEVRASDHCPIVLMIAPDGTEGASASGDCAGSSQKEENEKLEGKDEQNDEQNEKENAKKDENSNEVLQGDEVDNV